MTLLTNTQIANLAHFANMIEPFTPKLITELDGVQVIPYGCGETSYNISLDNNLMRPSTSRTQLLDPKSIRLEAYDQVFSDVIILEPNESILGTSREFFNIPHNIHAVVLALPSYARIFVNVTAIPLESGYSGYCILQLFNAGSMPAKLYAEEGVAQIVFYSADDQKERERVRKEDPITTEIRQVRNRRLYEDKPAPSRKRQG